MSILYLQNYRLHVFCILFVLESSSHLQPGAQHIAAMLKKFHNTEDLTLAVQDGALAGQTVPHVHIHLLPRREGDFKRKDDVYYQLENERERIDNRGEELRSEEDMAKEARTYTEYLNKLAEQEMS